MRSSPLGPWVGPRPLHLPFLLYFLPSNPAYSSSSYPSSSFSFLQFILALLLPFPIPLPTAIVSLFVLTSSFSYHHRTGHYKNHLRILCMQTLECSFPCWSQVNIYCWSMYISRLKPNLLNEVLVNSQTTMALSGILKFFLSHISHIWGYYQLGSYVSQIAKQALRVLICNIWASIQDSTCTHIQRAYSIH